MRRKVISSAGLLSLVLSTILTLSAIYSGIGTAKADFVFATVPVGREPFGIAFDSANGNLYVANQFSNTVSVISGQTNTVIGSPIPVGSFPVGIAFDSANGNLYVTNSGGNTVSVISGQTNTVIGSPIAVGSGPVGIAFDSANGNLYVTNISGNTVSVISTMLTPAQAIQQPIQLINGMHLNSGIQAGLDAQLNAISTTLSSPSNNNLPFACPRLNALTNAFC